ncbi:hypothetical protein WA158_003004 [Blastocystis sp. Blastoise]
MTLKRLCMNRKSLSVLSTPKFHSPIPLRSMSPSISHFPSINNTNISPITTTHRSSSTIPSSSSQSFTDSSNYSTQPLSSSTIPISNDYTQSYSSIQENNIYSDIYKELFKKRISETTHYNTPITLLPSSKYILYNIYLYSSTPSIDIHYSNNNNNEDNNTNIQSNDILDSTEYSFNIYIPLSISTEDQNYTINNSTKNDNTISYNEKNQSLIHIKEEHKIMKTETNNMIYNTNSIMNNNNTNENNIAYNNNMVFISTINNMSSTNNNVITTTNNNINNNSMIATNNNIYIPNATTITISTLLNPIHTTVSNSLPPTSYTIHSLSNLQIYSFSMTSESLSCYHNNSSDMNHLTN